MTVLAKDEPRVFELDGSESKNDLPVKAETKIFQGAYVGLSSGYARGITSGDTFAGIAMRQADNSDGANGDIDVELRDDGIVVANVVGVTGVDDVDTDVYASDDNTLTLTSSGGVKVGTIKRYITGTKCAVKFQAAACRSV